MMGMDKFDIKIEIETNNEERKDKFDEYLSKRINEVYNKEIEDSIDKELSECSSSYLVKTYIKNQCYNILKKEILKISDSFKINDEVTKKIFDHFNKILNFKEPWYKRLFKSGD